MEKIMFIYKITNLKKEHFYDSKYPKNSSPLHYDMKIYKREVK